MKLLVKRIHKSAVSTKGELWLDGEPFCYTLEPPVIDGDVKPRAIPLGTYDLTIRQSPRFKRLMPHVENVPGFEGILIHVGNYAHDTEGCLLVGEKVLPGFPDFIGESKKVFDPLFRKLIECKEPMTISYMDDVA